MKQAFKCFAAAMIGIFASVAMHAQVTTASFSGRVADESGPLPGVAVIAVHTPSGTQYNAISDKNGNFRLNGVTPGGPYTITAEILGYRTAETVGLYAPVGENVLVNFDMEIEAIGLEAAVTYADAINSNMNVDRAGAGTAVSGRTMEALPTVSRSMNDIMRLTPQASVTSNGLAVGGGNYRSSYVTVDGAAFNNAFGIGSNLPAGGAPISLDALEQMSVNITPFDVSQSGFTGGAINAVTKSGSNEWTFSLYNYFTNDQLQGDRVGDIQLTNSQSLNNTTGVSIGGPIIKNKLFFFVNFEYSADNVPGSDMIASKGDGKVGENWKPGTNVARPTATFLDEVRSYLMDTYGYDPGRYQGYSLSTPDWKLMARIDWNINNDHRFNIRFSHTDNKYSSDPSSSVNPIVPNPYNRNVYGRTSDYAMYFESSRYFQEQNFTSLAAELNSRFLDGMVNNMFRITWSHQNEPRSFVGDNFPTVDILYPADNGERAVLTSFGPDPFTYGNLRDVQTVVVTDEVSIVKGINNIKAGLQFEWNDTKNGFMQGGLGYYVYDSWESFVAAGKPVAFAITHSNRDDLQQVYPSFQYMQASAYVQDELNFNDRFKLTVGLRFEMPFYPSIEGNTNKEFLMLANTHPESSIYGLSTSDMPKARLNVSPRVGFNWDILGDRSLVLRGGTGIFTGRLPFVWIVSAAGSSNCLQAQYVDATGTGANTPNFHTNVSDILEDIYKGEFKSQDLAAPANPTILDKNLIMPTTWKTSLALDGRIPGGIKASLEGIYSHELTSVNVNLLGMQKTEKGITLPGEPMARNYWELENFTNSMGSLVNPYYITNSPVNGYYYSITAQLQKDFDFGLSLMAAYTHSGSKTVSDAIGDQITSAYNTMTYNVNGSNTPELGYATYVSPHRFIANISYRIKEGDKGTTTFGLFYEGYNHMYVGNYSYTRYSYTMNNVTGDYGANNLIYIPTSEELAGMPFVSDANRDAYEEFIASDKYLSRHRGEYSERGGAIAPWQSRFNFKFTQDIHFKVAGKTNTFQIGFDINNIANLLNPRWGLTDRMSGDQVLTYSEGKYEFEAPTWGKVSSTFSTWQMLISLRYFF